MRRPTFFFILAMMMLLMTVGKSYAVEFHECEKFAVSKEHRKHILCLNYSFREAVAKSDFKKVRDWISLQPKPKRYGDYGPNEYLSWLVCDSDGIDSYSSNKPFRKEDTAEIIALIDQLLKSGASFNSMPPLYLVTPLFCTSSRGSSEILDYVLTRIKADKDDLDGSLYEGSDPRYVPLYRAALNNHLDSAKVLVKHGATVDFYLPMFRPAIIAALENHHVAFANWLLDEGASVNQRDEKAECEEKTALEYALEIPKDVVGRDELVLRIQKLNTLPSLAVLKCDS